MFARRIRERVHSGWDPNRPLPPRGGPAAVGLACRLRMDWGDTWRRVVIEVCRDGWRGVQAHKCHDEYGEHENSGESFPFHFRPPLVSRAIDAHTIVPLQGVIVGIFETISSLTGFGMATEGHLS